MTGCSSAELDRIQTRLNQAPIFLLRQSWLIKRELKTTSNCGDLSNSCEIRNHRCESLQAALSKLPSNAVLCSDSSVPFDKSSTIQHKIVLIERLRAIVN